MQFILFLVCVCVCDRIFLAWWRCFGDMSFQVWREFGEKFGVTFSFHLQGILM